VKPTDIIRALAYPVTTLAVAIPLVVFWALIAFALWGGVLGLFLLFLVIPAVFRSQMILLEARARGVEPETPDIEFFNWFGNTWSLFPVPVVIVLALAIGLIRQHAGTAPATVAFVMACLFLPVFVTVLAVTRSPLQSLNPVALARLVTRCGSRLWIATAFLVLVASVFGNIGDVPTWLSVGVSLVIGYAFFSLVGSLVEPFDLAGDVDIPLPRERSADEVAAQTALERRKVLDHAYAFASRGNREGGLRHIMDYVDRQPDRVAAWSWFFDAMLRWENTDHALFFAQHLVHDLLERGERVRAVKALLRARLENERFRPLARDLQAAIEAAESTGNHELAVVLKRG